MMQDFPWATWAIIVTALGNALAGAAGSLPVGESALYASVVIIFGALGKALYQIGVGLQAANEGGLADDAPIQLDDESLYAEYPVPFEHHQPPETLED
jgi:hypothetical protein